MQRTRNKRSLSILRKVEYLKRAEAGMATSVSLITFPLAAVIRGAIESRFLNGFAVLAIHRRA